MLRTILFLNSIIQVLSFITPGISVFNEWHCIDFVKNIDKSKPFAYNVGDLSLVSWFHKNQSYTTLNICNHMGSKLDHGKVKGNCLVCPYHGLKYNDNMTFGKSLVFQDKLWWSYSPKKNLPPAIPFYNTHNYQTTTMKVHIDANIVDCAFNLMDINHPAYVHNNIFGFGSNVPPTDVKTVIYPHNKDKLGLSFIYKSNSIHLKRELRRCKNFDIYEYPYTTWSRVSLPNDKHLFVNINMLPISLHKTQWLVTLKHNFWNTNVIEQYMMAFAANCIIWQDKNQLAKQATTSELKKLVMFQTDLGNENHFKFLKDMFAKYEYPDTRKVLELYKYHKKKYENNRNDNAI